MTKKRNVLGRGLSALLDDNDDFVADQNGKKERPSGISEVPLSAVKPNLSQPRTAFDEEALSELAASIKIHGIIQPVTVTKESDGTYQLISGERRWRASKLAGKATIPVYIRQADDSEKLELALIENIQRDDLNAVEIALGYQRLVTECNLTHEALGERVGKKRSTVNNYLRLLKLPPDIQLAVRDNEIGMGHARALINIDTAEAKISLFKKIVREGLSVRQTEELARKMTSNGRKSPAVSTPTDDQEYAVRRISSDLSSRFGTKVAVKYTGKDNGEIRIPFLTTEDLNRLLELLNS